MSIRLLIYHYKKVKRLESNRILLYQIIIKKLTCFFAIGRVSTQLSLLNNHLAVNVKCILINDIVPCQYQMKPLVAWYNIILSKISMVKYIILVAQK